MGQKIVMSTEARSFCLVLGLVVAAVGCNEIRTGDPGVGALIDAEDGEGSAAGDVVESDARDSGPPDADADAGPDSDGDVLDAGDGIAADPADADIDSVDSADCREGGCPCGDEGDCASGICLSIADGRRICGGECDDGACPEGLGCVALFDSDGTEQASCLPPVLESCTACVLGSCGDPNLGCGALPDGPSCLLRCIDGRCPAGTTCAAMDSGALCVPESGVCTGCFDPDRDGFGLGRDCAGPDCDEAAPQRNAAAVEECNGLDDDCDGAVDEDFDLTSDPANCGQCGLECQLPGATADCAGSICVVAACDEGLGDCDHDATTGCETDLSTPDRCGGCRAFDPPPGTACGVCGEGELVCAGTSEIACDGDPGPDRLNGCGGCEALGAGLGDACGPCADGALACAGTDALECVGASALNACGGCGPVGPAGLVLGEECSGPCFVAACDPATPGRAGCLRREVAECAALGAVERLSATDATIVDYVQLTWTPLEGADRYRVYRDGVEISVTAGAALADLGAAPGGLPSAPVLTASTRLPDRVRLSWSSAAAPSGRTHVYSVVPENLGGRGPATFDVGSRGGSPISAYVVTLPSGATVEVRGALTWDDTSPAPSLPTEATFTASDGTHSAYVALAVSATAWETSTYGVAARNAAGTGPVGTAGGNATAARWRFEASDTSPPAAAWRALGDLVGTAWSDTTAPADGTHLWYRAVAMGSEGREWATAADEGWRWQRPAGRHIVQLALGAYHSCALRADGTARCWGRGSEGQLASGSTATVGLTSHVSLGRDVDFGGPIRELGAGHTSTCAWMVSGGVRCAGRFGALTTPIDTGALSRTVDVAVGGTIVDFAMGYNAVCVQLDTGAVRCWGSGAFGLLGQGNTADITAASMPPPDAFRPSDGVRALFGDGSPQFCALRNTGLVCWGDNQVGQNGQGNRTQIATTTPARSIPPTPILGFEPDRMFVRGTTCGLRDSDGTFRCWGDGRFGQLGVGSTVTLGDDPGEVAVAPQVGFRVEGVAFGGGGACVWDAEGNVRCYGGSANRHGIGYESIEYLGDEPGEMPTPNVNLGGPVDHLAGGGQHICALMRDGQVKCWQSGAFGQLGNGLGGGSIGATRGTMPPPPVVFE